MFEIAGVPEETARERYVLRSHKLPCKCKNLINCRLEGGDNGN